MKLWLTRCDGGRYMLTLCRPRISRIRGTTILDAFEQEGEPIAVRHLCAAGVRSLFGQEFEPLTPTRVQVTAEIAASPADQNGQ